MTRTREVRTMFPIPFQIAGYGKLIPAGTYTVEIVEEEIRGLSYRAFRRISTTLMLSGLTTGSDERLFLSVAQADLDDAQKID